MQQKHVQVVRSQPAQAAFQTLPEPAHGKICSAVRRVPEFADQHDLFALASQRVAEHALDLDAGFVPAWVNLADLMRIAGREADAEATLRAGLKQVPGAAPLHHSLGLSLVRQQRKPEALKELKRATELDPTNRRYAYVYEVARADLAQ